MENIYTFYKEDLTERWYISLPDFPGPKEALEMVEGADLMLDIFLNMYYPGKDRIKLRCEIEPFEGAEELIKQDVSNNVTKTLVVEEVGGWYYSLPKYDNIDFNIEMWLCDVTKYVFGNFPEKIYIKHI